MRAPWHPALHPLERKLLRDLWHYRGQLAAIVLVVTSGVALFVTMRSMNGFLRGSRDAYYAEYRFPQVFAPLRRAPMRVAREAARIPGVAVAEPRIVEAVTLQVRGLAEPASGLLVSIPVPAGEMLSRLHLSSGRWPDPARPAEVIASVAFARANRLVPGDSLGAVLGGRWQWLRVTGTAISPEYVYEIAGGAIFPDNRRFGVLWMARDPLARAFGMQGAFNDLAIATVPGAREEAVIAALDRLLEPWGGSGAHGRSAQLSHQFLTGEIEETQVTSVLLPAIFLGVTAFLLNMVLSRLIATQREQLATLKAFGYGNARVAVHYLEFALLPVVAGCVLGTALGLVLARRMAGVYTRFFQFPSPAFTPQWDVVAVAVLVGLAAGATGALGAVRRSASLPPAEAMRPEGPARFRPGFLERFAWFRALSPSVHLVARTLERRPIKAALGVLGIAMAVGIVITVMALFDAIQFMRGMQFMHVAREDVTVVFDAARPRAALGELRGLPGVMQVDPFRQVPVRLHGERRTRHVAIASIDAGRGLHLVLDRELRPPRVPPEGLLLSGVLAEVIGARPGDSVLVEVLEPPRARQVLEVAGVVNDLFGMTAWMDEGALQRLLGDAGTISGAWLQVDPRRLDALYAALRRLTRVQGVSVRAAELATFDRTIRESFSISLVTAMVFACIIAFGVVYNGARVALSERGRELASLRVLGFTEGEVARVLLGEQALLTALAVPTGWLVAWGLCWLLATRFTSELYRLPIVVRGPSYVGGAALVAAAAALSGFAVRRRIARLDLVEVLKARE